MSAYPRRDSHHAHKLTRLLFASCAAQTIGQQAALLIVHIAHAEDASRYQGPARFWNSQLMEALGFKNHRQLNTARQAAIDSGWLVYERDHNRLVGMYWTTFPPGVMKGNDPHVESQPEVKSQPAVDSPVTIPSSRDTNCAPISDSRSASSSNPSPNPNPNHFVTLVEQWNRIPGIIPCRSASAKRKAAYQARSRDPTWLTEVEVALQRVADCPFLRGVNDRGWKADFDWFLQPDSLTKILEGKYDRQPAASKSVSSPSPYPPLQVPRST